MINKDIKVAFNAPLHPLDTDSSTYGCRQNNPNICGNNGLIGICAFASDDFICKKTVSCMEKTISKNQGLKPLNYRLSLDIAIFTHSWHISGV